MYHAVFSAGRYYLYDAPRSVFGVCILFILCTTQNFWGLDTIHTMDYAGFSGGRYEVFSGCGYDLYYALRSIFGGSRIFILCTTQYFRRVDTICTMYHEVFSGCGYYLYYVQRIILEVWILVIQH